MLYHQCALLSASESHLYALAAALPCSTVKVDRGYINKDAASTSADGVWKSVGRMRTAIIRTWVQIMSTCLYMVMAVVIRPTLFQTPSAERHRLKIIEDILTLRCPHPTCNLVIIDFDGCFAVQHSEGGQGIHKQGCGLYFCGWCLEKCWTNADCHNHVKACRHNLHPGSYYGTKDEFDRTHVERRRALVRKYLQENVLDVQEREAIKSALRKDLDDLRFDI